MFCKEDFGFVTDCKTTYFCEEKQKYKQYAWYTYWINMIKRCYDENNPSYKNYGAKGIYVSEEFKKLSAFRDFYLENNPEQNLDMDKDFLGKGYYGKDSIIFISHSVNVSESTERNMEIHINRLKKQLGFKHPKAKQKKFYETKATTKSNFKKICKTQGWNFDDFEHINSGEKAKDRHYLYFFKEKIKS